MVEISERDLETFAAMISHIIEGERRVDTRGTFARQEGRREIEKYVREKGQRRGREDASPTP